MDDTASGGGVQPLFALTLWDSQQSVRGTVIGSQEPVSPILLNNKVICSALSECEQTHQMR